MTTTGLTQLSQRAAEYVEAHGWTQGTEQDGQGRVCLTGALRLCSPQSGDWTIARAVLRRRKRAEDWNDTAGRTQAEVVETLRSVEITDEDLAETFGPQWESIVALVRSAATLTPGQADDLDAAWSAARSAARDAAWSAAGDAAWSAARSAAGDAARSAAGDAAGGAARSAAGDAAWSAAGDAARDAARALVVRDLIGQHCFTQQHYDLLTAHWAKVSGPVHLDDEVLA